MYQAIYKCRLCGEVFQDEKGKFKELKDFRITNIFAQMEQHIIWNNYACANMHKLHSRACANIHKMHNCKDGSFGFADFKGFKKMED